MLIDKPIDPTKRIEILDILRGFALLGIIFNNIQYFSGYTFLPLAGLRELLHYDLNEQIYHFLDIIVTGKFYTLFSLLFAVGFYLQFSKYRDDTKVFLKTYRRRLFLLLMIAVFHNLIWFGDILFLYAISGFILILFRKMRSKSILVWSLFFFILPFLFDFATLLFGGGTGPAGTEMIHSGAHSSYPGMSSDALVHTLANGSFAELFSLNTFILKWKWMGYIPSGRLFITFGIFLLGYFLASVQFFKDLSKSYLLWIGSLVIGLLTTLAAYGIGGDVYMYPSTLVNTGFKMLLLIGQVSMCFFYMMTIFRIVHSKSGEYILNYLKPVGRMALTNYIMQTVICILIFSNFGLDLICRIDFVYAVLIALGVVILQIIFSNIWLNFFRFGPLEWIWRCLTYKKMIKIKC